MNNNNIPFQVDIPRVNDKYIRSSASIVAGNTGKNITTARLFRACYQHVNKSFRIPVNVTIPTSINVQSWIHEDNVESEVIQHTLHFQIGPFTDHEYSITPYGNLRKLTHLSLFQQLSTLIITKQQLEDVEMDFPLNVQHLDLSFNRFKHVPTKVTLMKYLRVLKMPGNALQEIKAVRSLPLTSLIELHVQDNEQLRLIDLSGMMNLQFMNCRKTHSSLKLINCSTTTPREILVDENKKSSSSSSSIKRIFVDQDEEDAIIAYSSSSDHHHHHHATTTTTSGWSLLNSTEWIAQLQEFRMNNLFVVEEIRKESIQQLQDFFLFYESAFLLEVVVPAKTKLALAKLQDCCAFRFFYPSFHAIASDSLKKKKLIQFATFLRFCEAQECFLDWKQIERPQNLHSLFAASKFTIDLLSVFPSPNEMHRELADSMNNPSLFTSILIDRFTNNDAIQRFRVRLQEEENAKQRMKQRTQLMITEIQELAKTDSLQPKHIDALVDYELECNSIV